MPTRNSSKRKPTLSAEQRRIRTQRIIFAILAIILIISWIVTLVVVQ